MKRLIVTALLLLLITPPGALAQNAKPVAAPSLDEVLAKYYDAIGGLDNWQKVDTMVVEGSIHTQDLKIPTVAEYKRPDKCRVEYTIRGEV
ncbi:MAG: hypothetical protein KJ002_12850, partial [Candidatus Dadabacteria bacterium]|nr:hypothetical protein [Candidatus Dadabacteria bacterium]